MKKIIFTVLLIYGINYLLNAQEDVNGVIISEDDNLTVVQVWGDHNERGYAQGYLLADQMYDLFTNYLIPQIGSYMPYAKDIIAGGEHISVDSKYVTEAQGIIAGMADAGIDTTGLDYLDVLVANSSLDLQGFDFFKGLKGFDFGMSCSALMSWGDATLNTQLNGESVISRHLDWETDESVIGNQVMVAHLPSEPGEQNWVMTGCAGQIGGQSGFNTNGQAVFLNTMGDFPGQEAQTNQAYQPIQFALRDALEINDYNDDGQYNSNDLMAAIEANTQGYADGFIISCLAPADTGVDNLTAVIAEITPTDPKIVTRYNAYEDNIPGDNLYAANGQIKRNDEQNYCSRYNATAAALENGEEISAEINWAIMRDSSSQEINLQFMQFVPDQRYINISAYRNGTPAYTHDSTRYYMDDLFDEALFVQSEKHTQAFCHISPNPVSDMVTIKFTGEPNELFTCKIYNELGHLINLKHRLRTNTITLSDISDISINEGMYFLILSGNKGTKHKEKFIVIK
ncbi:MAG: T9SS type A sorting domain-containing protein [Bacteroidales bacterium]